MLLTLSLLSTSSRWPSCSWKFKHLHCLQISHVQLVYHILDIVNTFFSLLLTKILTGKFLAPSKFWPETILMFKLLTGKFEVVWQAIYNFMDYQYSLLRDWIKPFFSHRNDWGLLGNLADCFDTRLLFLFLPHNTNKYICIFFFKIDSDVKTVLRPYVQRLNISFWSK